MKKTIEHAAEAVKSIKEMYKVNVILEHNMPTIVNMKTGETTGFAVVIRLSTRYSYGEEMLTKWKQMIGADDWNFGAKGNQLHVKFLVHVKETGK